MKLNTRIKKLKQNLDVQPLQVNPFAYKPSKFELIFAYTPRTYKRWPVNWMIT